MIRRHRIGSALCALSACLTLAGCSPEITGSIGVGVDASGQPVGYVQSCRGVVDGTVVSAEPLRDDQPDIGRWEARPVIAGFSSWSMTNPAGNWRATTRMQELRPDVVYHLMGGNKENTGSTGYVLFTLADLRAMKPGEVRIYDDARAMASAQAEEPTLSPAEQAREENTFMEVVSVARFRAEACAQDR